MNATSPTNGNSSVPGQFPKFLDSRYSWMRLLAAMVIATVGNVGMWSIIVILPKIQSEFDIDRAEASLPFAAIMMSFGIGNVLVGRFADRFGIALPLFLSSIMLGSGFYLSTLATNIWQFAVLQGVLVGFGTAASFGPLMSDISQWFHKRLGIAIAAAASGNYFAGMLWPLYLKDIIATEGWREAHFAIAIIVVSVIAPLSFFMRRRPPSYNVLALSDNFASAPTRKPRRAIDMNSRTLLGLLIVAGIACCVAMSMPQVHIVAYCADLGYGVARGAEMLSLMLMGGIISRLASGVLADYIGGIRTLLIGSVLQMLSLFLYMPFDGLISLYVVSLVFGLSQGGIVPSYAIIIREYLPSENIGQRVGLVVLATVFGMSFGGWLSGFIFDLTRSYQAAFINGIAWNLLNIAIICLLLWRRRKPEPTVPTPATA